MIGAGSDGADGPSYRSRDIIIKKLQVLDHELVSKQNMRFFRFIDKLVSHNR